MPFWRETSNRTAVCGFFPKHKETHSICSHLGQKCQAWKDLRYWGKCYLWTGIISSFEENCWIPHLGGFWENHTMKTLLGPQRDMKATLDCGHEHLKDGNVFLNCVLWADEPNWSCLGKCDTRGESSETKFPETTMVGGSKGQCAVLIFRHRKPCAGHWAMKKGKLWWPLDL